MFYRYRRDPQAGWTCAGYPIIALTVNEKDERKTYISGGKNDYVTKPI